ncbi:tetratricopeptide repeat protein [Streptomyces sp. E11-3]|uniref:hypothetical protein n=1 Tax=Streptomyces sp. E11-3 TaxID=3110112 RepID=UPI00397FD8CD
MGAEGVRNEFGGTAGGPVVQAGTIGQIHVAPPPPPPPVTPRQVPRGPATFVDRTTTFDSIDGRTGLTVLSGLPGIGKSAVARSWAERQRESFPGGDFYVDFAELRRRQGADVSAGLSGCLRALGVADPYLPPTLGELSALFRSRTAAEPVLVVLANVTEPAQVRALIPGGSGSVVLATSQDRLAELVLDGAQLLTLGPLSADHGLQLIGELCGAHRVAEEPEAAARIVGYCSGLPVALHVAAARLLSSRRLTLALLATELADEQRRLDALRTGGKKLVTAVFNVAYDGLGPDAARMYRLLGVYPGRRWDTATAAALARLTEWEAAELLDVLEEASLIESAEDGRYAFHDLVRLHARQRAEDEDAAQERDAAVRRSADHLLNYAAYADLAVMGGRLRAGTYTDRVTERMADDGPFTGRSEALEWLDSRRAELLAAVRAAAAIGLRQQTTDLAEALTALYLNRRYLADWVESGELGVRAAVADGDPAVEARLRCLLSRPLLDRGEDDRARDELETAVERADESGHLLLRASAREFAGRYWDRHDGERAIAVYAEALDLYRRHGDPRGIAIGLYFMGCAQDAAGRHSAALATLRDAYARFMAIGDGGDRRMGARAKAAIGACLRNLGQGEEAVTELTSAVEMLREVRAVHYEAPAREQLAELAGERGDLDSRREHLLRALEIYEEGGSPRADEVRRRL